MIWPNNKETRYLDVYIFWIEIFELGDNIMMKDPEKSVSFVVYKARAVDLQLSNEHFQKF
jgi:hypothetical protein